ncbi:MAG TPA: FAD-dependent oxidoreductase, partial [Burkholderiaceae bacterium]|nr:FAD-dependent oxidoreductase [Burkholderiaceae bacterium]
MRVAVVGAGIVGACTAWALARHGVECTLFDRRQPMCETSRASSKLLHGGLRYLETGQFRLVGKALHARTDWLELAPHLCHRLEMLLPMYRDKGRSQFLISAGIRIYDVLALGSGFPRARVLKPSEVLALQPGLSAEGLVGAWAFFDAQMDDYALGNWVVDEFCDLGGDLVTEHEVRDLAELDDYDRIVNATGPWAMQLRETQPGKPSIQLDWVRGSHIVLDRVCPAA